MSSSDRRIATLLPSATEIVYALGAEPVATSHECDHPPAAADKPNANRARVDPTAAAGEIDAQVQDADDSGGVYEIRGDVLESAAPDIVVSQGICDVCAVDEVLVREAIEEYDLDCELLTTDPHSLSDLYRDIEQVGTALGREERAQALVDRLQSRVAAIESRVPNREPERVAVFDWTSPVMVAGHWIPGMVTRLGGEFGLQEPEAASRPLEWETVREYDPEVIVVAPCGFDLEQIHENLGDLTDRDGWADLTAVENDRVYAVNGHSLMNRPGPRLVESLEALAWCLYPDAFERPAGDFAEQL
ncbi:MAG: ABC transporter substrate-binding protein [Halobacteriales archaeon]|nr:ABC transporter substrate-binding protein [Halobacteriales archaeon]